MIKDKFLTVLISTALIFLFTHNTDAQSYAFGLKMGPTLGIQQWNGSNTRQPLVRYHATAFIESAPVENNYALFAQLGYHEVGSSVRKLFRDRGYLYYGFGLRGEFNLGMYSTGYLQGYDGFQNRLTYGIIVNTGLELPFGEFVSGIVELSIGPDFSKQINIGPIDTGYNNSNGSTIILGATEVTNIFVELSVGMRFLHKITYID